MSETVNKCEAQLADWLRQAFQAAFGDVQEWSGIRVQPATDPRFGDFQCNDAMQVSKTLRRPPRAVAEAALAALPLPPMLTKAEIAGPGFINLTVSPAWLAEQVAALSAAPRFGIPDAARARPSSSTTGAPTWPSPCISATSAPP